MTSTIILRFTTTLILAALLMAAGSVGTALGQATGAGPAGPRDASEVDDRWELRVCADPNSQPFSAVDGTGFENRIAVILAEELGARLTFDWYPQGPEMVDQRLREGECDLIMGVPDGYRELLTTVAYYRSPYVFVYRADAPFELESFDDPVLADLRIGLQSPVVPPRDALINRGLQGNIVRTYQQHAFAEGAAYVARLVSDVASGAVDVGIAWGPGVGFYAQQYGGELVVLPVQPQIEPPFTPMSFAMTMAVRQGDESLRDRLDLALAARWDEIQTLLAEYGVPLEPIPGPRAQSAVGGPEVARLGLVAPTLTRGPVTQAGLNEPIGEAARRGALLAEGEVFNQADTDGIAFDVLIASAPTPEAAARAAARLVATEDVTALMGGVGEGQAAAIAHIAEERGVPFLNLADPSAELREQCRAFVFHVAPSAAMYADAMTEWYGGQGHRSWFVVHEDTPEAAAAAARLSASVSGAGAANADEANVSGVNAPGSVVGTAAVRRGQPSYMAEIGAAHAVGADIVALLLDAPDQIAFLGQLDSAGSDLAAAPFPDPVTQTREYIAAARLRTAGAGVTHRIAAWEATLEEGGAGELNARYASRWGEPMEPTAWAAYEAVRILYQATRAAGPNRGAIAAYLTGPDAPFDLHKGVDLSFRRGDHQLWQPLYAVEVDPEATWGITAGQRTAVARLAGVLGLGSGKLGAGSEGAPEQDAVREAFIDTCGD